jgi:hypothetical protein
MMFACVSFSFAAVTLGGNMRVWYESSTNTGQADKYAADFRFDRLAFTFASDLTAVDGLKGEVQFRSLRSDTSTAAGNGASDSVIRIDNATYYHKALFLDSDEFDAGVIQQLPFRNTAYNGVLLESLANKLVKDTNSVGIKYAGAIDQFDFAFALVDSANQWDVAQDGTTQAAGLDYGFRVGFAPMNNLKIGLGYINDYTNMAVATSVQRKTAYVVDANGNFGPFGAYAEYLSVTPQVNGSNLDTGNGLYTEASYKVSDPFTVYVGRAVNLSSNAKANIHGSNYIGTMDFYDADPATGKTKYGFTNDWSLLGVKYQVAPNSALQGEYIVQDTDSSIKMNVIAVRLKVDF